MPAEFERTFDNAAREYEATRPEYPPALYGALLRYQPLSPQSRVLEIGLGTGKAAGPVLQTGCQFIGLEPGGNLAALAAQRLRGFANFRLSQTTLQDFCCPDASLDLVYAATAFHWLPEEYAYRRVYDLLRPGGAFARFAYRAGPDKKRLALTEEVDGYYQQALSQKGKYRELQEEDIQARAALAERYGFTQTAWHLYHMQKDFTAQEYMALLRTYRDHMALDPASRQRLFEGIYSAIQRHGGVMTVYYTVDLELARKPAAPAAR